MTDVPSETEFEHCLPTAYAQGFARVRVVAVSNPDHTGPLALSRAAAAATADASTELETAANDLEPAKFLSDKLAG